MASSWGDSWGSPTASGGLFAPSVAGAGGSTLLIKKLLASESGSVTTVSQIFSTASTDRQCVVITNSGGRALYVGHTSDTSASKYLYKVLPGQTLILSLSPIVPVYLFATTSTNYTAHEFSVWS